MKLVRTTIALLFMAILCYAVACGPGINDRRDYCGDGEGNAALINPGYYTALQSSLVAFTSDSCDGDGSWITSRYNPKQKTRQKQKTKQKHHGVSHSVAPVYMLPHHNQQV